MFQISNNFNFKFVIIVSPWILILLSIGSIPSDISYFGESLVKTLNSFRISISLLLSILFILFFIWNLFINFNSVKKINNNLIIFYLFLFYFLFQFLGLIQRYAGYEQINLENLYLIILGSGSIIFFLLIYNFKLSNYIKHITLTTILIVLISGLIIFIVHISKSTFASANYFSLYNSVPAGYQFFFNHELPRVTGISRTLAILNLFLINIYFIYNKKKNIFLIFIITLSIIIFAFQSRGSILCFVLTFFFLLSCIQKINLAKKIIIFFIIIITPYLLFESIRYIQLEKLKNSETELPFDIKNEKSILPFDIKKKKSINILIEKNRLINDHSSSGRLNLWTSSLKLYDYKKKFGYGPQGDRFLLIENLKIHTTNNVSNAFFYAFLSGGYFGLVIFSIIYFQIFLLIFKKILKEKIFHTKNNYIETISILILFFFLVRSGFENSFSVFSIDFVLVISSIAALLPKGKKIIN